MGQFPFSVSEILLYVLLGCVLWWIGKRITPVSYTHLDVYKRQVQYQAPDKLIFNESTLHKLEQYLEESFLDGIETYLE